MFIEEKNKISKNNSIEDNNDKSDSDEENEENTFSHRGMSRKKKFYLSKLLNQEQSDHFF